MKSTTVALQVIGLQILISIPVYLGFYALFGDVLYSSQDSSIRILRILILLLLFTCVFWITLRILKNKINQTDFKSFILKISLTSLAFGLADFLTGGGLITILYSPISYVFAKKYFKK